jgi:hypothetical protein
MEVKHVPTFGENLTVFLLIPTWPYVLAIFYVELCGRQNDIQGHGDLLKGNWISGIPAIDKLDLDHRTTFQGTFRNKAHNRYYMLPFLLGIAGLLIQYLKNRKDFGLLPFFLFLLELPLLFI